MNARALCDLPPEFLPEAGLDAYFRVFEEYARTFYTGDAAIDFHLDLKAEHSRNVFAHARALAGQEREFASDPVRSRALLLAALFHDFGRFKQYAVYKTFSDPQSMNHAHLSAGEIKRLGILRNETPEVRRLAMAAIVLHNRFALPDSMNADARAVANAVRDADKLDIMRIMASYLTEDGPIDPVIVLHVADSPKVTPAVLAAVAERRPGRYADMCTTTDFKLLVCGWFYGLNHASSRRMASSGGHLAAILASLPETGELRAFCARFRRELADYAAT